MAISDLLNRRVKARPEEEEDDYTDASDSGDQGPDEVSDEDDQDNDESDGSLDGTDDGSDDGSEGSEQENEDEEAELSEDEEDNGDEDIQASLNNISFGALAKAQASMGSKNKKKRAAQSNTESAATTASPLDDIRARIREAREQKRQSGSQSKDTEKKLARASKHAPTVQSSKHAVSRRRTVVEPPAIAKSRDPRFDPTIRDSGKWQNPNAANKAYAFLDEYRASELKDLKEQMAKTKDPVQKEKLKGEIRSRSDRMRASENKKREQEILAEHKKNEKQLIREGKKSNPYFLKKSDLKKQMLTKKYEGMGSRDRAKALERRRKKIASKERKEMPWERRGMEGAGDEGRKRRRLE